MHLTLSKRVFWDYYHEFNFSRRFMSRYLLSWGYYKYFTAYLHFYNPLKELCKVYTSKRIHVFSVKQNSRTENFQTEHCRKENSGTRKFQESQFVMEFENFVLEQIPGFYFKQGRKFQDFWLIIITGVKILWQNFPRHSIF